MSRLKALFNKGFMKLAGGRRITILEKGEVVVTGNPMEDLRHYYVENERLKKEIRNLKQMKIQSYRNGVQQGLKRSSNRTLLLPAAIREDNKHLVDIVGSIASELLEQGVLESCAWLFKKIIQCRSL